MKVSDNCGLPTDWSPDARLLLFEPGSVIPAIGLLHLDTGEKSEIVADAGRGLRAARFSTLVLVGLLPYLKSDCSCVRFSASLTR